MGAQLYDLLIENGSEPLKKEEVDDMMDDCAVGGRLRYPGRSFKVGPMLEISIWVCEQVTRIWVSSLQVPARNLTL